MSEAEAAAGSGQALASCHDYGIVASGPHSVNATLWEGMRA